jgi:hypothetical protein
MPMNRSRYPDNWDDIAHHIKTKAGWKCVECERPCRMPGEPVDEFVDRINTNHPEWADDLVKIKLAKATVNALPGLDVDGGNSITVSKVGRFTLTVAHLDHVPENCDADNLRAWCSVCHCRYDLKAMPTKKNLKCEFNGQQSLFTTAKK